MLPRLAGLAAVLLLAIVATGCSKRLEIDSLEPQLANQLSSKLQTTGITVDCPTDVKAEAGATFDCTATLTSGDTLTMRVTQKDANGTVTWALAAAAAGSATPSPSSSP